MKALVFNRYGGPDQVAFAEHSCRERPWYGHCARRSASVGRNLTADWTFRLEAGRWGWLRAPALRWRDTC